MTVVLPNSRASFFFPPPPPPLCPLLSLRLRGFDYLDVYAASSTGACSCLDFASFIKTVLVKSDCASQVPAILILIRTYTAYARFAMSVTIHLDRPHKHFTNLDVLVGKVVLTLPSEAAIGGIQVKLEGESRTRLAGPRYPHHEQSDKKRTEIEVHKVRHSTVSPTPPCRSLTGKGQVGCPSLFKLLLRTLTAPV